MKCYDPQLRWPPKLPKMSAKMLALGIEPPTSGGRWVDKEADAQPGSLPQLTPCGNCLACRARATLDMSTRMGIELADATARGLPSWMVTLTYANENLPDDFSVSKREMQLWLKRVRNEFGMSFRYYIAAEYGTSEWGTKRPHYHALLFGLPLDKALDPNIIEGECHEVRSSFMGLSLPATSSGPSGRSDLIPADRSQAGFPTWKSPRLEKTWRDWNMKTGERGPLKGFVDVNEANQATISYVAGYVTKKLNKEGDDTGRKIPFIDPERDTEFVKNQHIKWLSPSYERLNPITGQVVIVRPEFALMSRGGRYADGAGGLGASFVEKYRDTDLQHDFMTRGGKRLPMPRYFVQQRDALLLAEHGEEALAREKMRRAALAIEDGLLHREDNTPERRAVREESHHLRTKALARGDESVGRRYSRGRS